MYKYALGIELSNPIPNPNPNLNPNLNPNPNPNPDLTLTLNLALTSVRDDGRLHARDRGHLGVEPAGDQGLRGASQPAEQPALHGRQPLRREQPRLARTRTLTRTLTLTLTLALALTR